MLIFGREIAKSVVALAVGGIVLLIAVSIALTQCQKNRSQEVQGRVDQGQAGAASESANDAIGTVSEAGKREAASEGLTRANERDIRGADGAGDQMKPGVANAGRAALCKRAAYRDDPRCKGAAR